MIEKGKCEYNLYSKKIPEINFPKRKILTGELPFCSFGLAPVLFLEYFDIKLVEESEKKCSCQVN